VYGGVTMIASAAVLGSIFVIKKFVDKNLQRGIKIIIVGSIIQILAGLGDSISHDEFGIDGLVSLSHQPLEFGLVLCALGGFLIIKSSNNKKLKKILPVSIITLIFAISWLGFNLSLLVGGTILCLPFYEMFSSGCAIL
jgi:energy-coupling factor transporter transmembrane protein EcfT